MAMILIVFQGGTLVTSHCNTDDGARNAIEGGVGGIEHGGLLSDDTLRLMAKKGIHYTPTLIIQDVSHCCYSSRSRSQAEDLSTLSMGQWVDQSQNTRSKKGDLSPRIPTKYSRELMSSVLMLLMELMPLHPLCWQSLI